MKVTRQRFEKIADRIVTSAYGSEDLSEAVAKTATEMSLSPEAIKTLLQMVNTIASLKHLDESPDRSEAFPLAEPSKVLRIVFNLGDEEAGDVPEAPELEPEPSADFSQPPSEDIRPSADEDPVPEVVPEEEEAEETPEGEVKEASLAPQVFLTKSASFNSAARRRGQVAVFRTKLALVEQEYVDHLDYLASDFIRLGGPEIEPFEKDALYVYGDEAKEPLAAVRSAMHYPDMDEDALEKCAGVKIVDTSTASMRKLARMLELNKMHKALGEAIETLAADLVT